MNYRKIKANAKVTDIFRVYFGLHDDAICGITYFHIISIRRSIEHYKSSLDKEINHMLPSELIGEICFAMEMLMIIVQCTIKNPDEISLGSTIKKDIKSLLNEVKVLIDGFVQESPGLLSGKSVKRSYPPDELIGYVEKIW